jgi:hypothetical protein
MKSSIKLIAFLFLILIGTPVFSQMSTVVTGKEDIIKNKHKTFIILNEKTGLVMAKTPVKYDAGAEMPLCYFTIDNPANIVFPGSSRHMVIHDLGASQVGDSYDWVLEVNPDEKDVFFSRSKFITMDNGKWWNVLVNDDRIILQNLATDTYLVIDESGDYSTVPNRKEASLWKLIYVY